MWVPFFFCPLTLDGRAGDVRPGCGVSVLNPARGSRKPLAGTPIIAPVNTMPRATEVMPNNSNNGTAPLDPQLTGNVGLYYCCYRLSLLGWNVMPTARNARGVDIIAYSRDASRFVGVQVKALSKRSPVPLGTSLDKIMGDFWVIVNKVAAPTPSAFILLPSEVRERAHRGEKDGRVSYWLQPGDYEQDPFREAWERIGHGGV